MSRCPAGTVMAQESTHMHGQHEAADPPRDPALGPALVIEDDTLIAMDAADALRALGADPVECCATVEAAREALVRLEPAVVVLDIHLGDRHDGWVFAELVSALGPTRPRLIFATGAPETIPAEIAALGTVVSKPYGRADLARALAAPRGGGLLGRLKEAIVGDDPG